MFSVVHAEDQHACHNLAFDEALLRARPRGSAVWLWRNPRCVVLGRGQTAEREVDLAACSSDGVPVLRRGSGGGTVYHDPGNLNITLVRPGAVEPLALLGETLSTVVGSLGLRPRLTKRGLFVDGKKLCGFAALRTKHGVLAHSTLLVSTPAELVGRYLAPQPENTHPLDSHRSPVTSLAAQGISAHPEQLIIDGFVHTLGPAAARGATESEVDHQARLLHTRYGFSPWHLTGAERKEEACPLRCASSSTA